MSDWQAIDTAPKDGTPIRLKAGQYEGVGAFSEHGLDEPPFFKMRGKDIGWTRANPPTHWKPI